MCFLYCSFPLLCSVAHVMVSRSSLDLNCGLVRHTWGETLKGEHMQIIWGDHGKVPSTNHPFLRSCGSASRVAGLGILHPLAKNMPVMCSVNPA